MNSTMEARLRRSCSAAATNAAFTSGGTRTLTTSVFVTVKEGSCVKNASVLQRVSGPDSKPPGLPYTECSGRLPAAAQPGRDMTTAAAGNLGLWGSALRNQAGWRS